MVTVVRCDGRDNTKKLWNFLSIVVPKKAVVGYIGLEQKKTCEKLKNRGWYSEWYWYFNNDTMITNMMIILLLVLLLLLLTINESNNCNNYNNNHVLIIKIVITIKIKSGCASKWKKIKSSYIYYSSHFLFGEKNAP